MDHQPRTDILAPPWCPVGRWPDRATWFFAALIALAGCRSNEPAGPPELPAVGGQVSLIRVPLAGGIVEAYDPEALAQPIWISRTAIPPLREILGVNLEARLLVAVDTLKNLVVVDLESRGIRAQTGSVEHATMSPDGSVYTVGANRRVTRVDAGLPAPYRTQLPVPPQFHVGTLGERYVALVGTAPRQLLILSQDRQLASIEAVAGEAAATLWGDLVAIAADKRVLVYATEDPFETRTIPIGNHARRLLFSPSGHRLYVAGDDRAVLVFDRYSLAKLTDIGLPGVPDRLRIDASGRWMVTRPAIGDSTWVVDLATGRYLVTAESEWDRDLPTVAGAATLLVRQGADAIALELARPGLRETGRVVGGAEDGWIVTNWVPSDRLAQAAATAESLLVRQDGRLVADSQPSTPVADRLFLQVSSSQNPDWSRELAKQLTAGGYPARVLDPTTADDGFRVVIGPYATREEAEEAGRKLGRPYFILTNPPIRR